MTLKEMLKKPRNIARMLYVILWSSAVYHLIIRAYKAHFDCDSCFQALFEMSLTIIYMMFILPLFIVLYFTYLLAISLSKNELKKHEDAAISVFLIVSVIPLFFSGNYFHFFFLFQALLAIIYVRIMVPLINKWTK